MPIVLAIIAVIGVFLIGNNAQVKHKKISLPTPTVTQPTSTPVQETPSMELPNLQGAQVYQDPDPITECQNPNCGSIRIKKSLCSNVVGYVCCQVGSAWTWYASRDKCSQDQQNYLDNERVKNTTRNTSNSEPNITCVLSWGTYQLPKSICDGYKNSPQITPYTGNSITYPTYAPIPTVDHQKYQQDCINQENQTYDSLIFEYKRNWGENANIETMYQQHMRNLADCRNL